MKKTLFIMFLTFLAGSMYAQDLFFSEYIEGTGNNKCVEIYNPTSQAIDLNDYYVIRFSNGSSVFTEGGATHLSGTIAPYKTFVLENGQTISTGTSPACSPVLQAMADQLDHDYPAPMYMNGNDAIALVKDVDGTSVAWAKVAEKIDLLPAFIQREKRIAMSDGKEISFLRSGFPRDSV